MDQFNRQNPQQSTQPPMGIDPKALFMQVLGSRPQNIEYLRANKDKTLGQICAELGINL